MVEFSATSKLIVKSVIYSLVPDRHRFRYFYILWHVDQHSSEYMQTPHTTTWILPPLWESQLSTHMGLCHTRYHTHPRIVSPHLKWDVNLFESLWTIIFVTEPTLNKHQWIIAISPHQNNSLNSSFCICIRARHTARLSSKLDFQPLLGLVIVWICRYLVIFVWVENAHDYAAMKYVR